MSQEFTTVGPLPGREYITSAMVTILPGVSLHASVPTTISGVRCRVVWTPDGGKYLVSSLAFRNRVLLAV